MVKRFYIYSPDFPKIATTMRAFEKMYKESIETMYFGTTPTIELKEDGGVKNVFIFVRHEAKGTMTIADFIKHYFPDSRKNPLA